MIIKKILRMPVPSTGLLGVDALARRLQVADAALFEHALSKAVIGLDQTGWRSLDGMKDKPWQMWCIAHPTSSVTAFARIKAPRPSRRCSASTSPPSFAMP